MEMPKSCSECELCEKYSKNSKRSNIGKMILFRCKGIQVGKYLKSPKTLRLDKNAFKFRTHELCPLQQPQLDSDIEEAIINVSNKVWMHAPTRILQDNLNTIKKAFTNKDKLIYESQKAQMNMKSKLDKIEEIANRKFSTSRRLEDIQQELDNVSLWKE